MIITKLDRVRYDLDQLRQQTFARPQDCAIRLSRDTLIDLLAEYSPHLNRFELEAYADTIGTLYGAKVIIDEAAQEPVVSLHVRFIKSETVFERREYGRPELAP